jgi:hypothetical protein
VLDRLKPGGRLRMAMTSRSPWLIHSGEATDKCSRSRSRRGVFHQLIGATLAGVLAHP